MKMNKKLLPIILLCLIILASSLIIENSAKLDYANNNKHLSKNLIQFEYSKEKKEVICKANDDFYGMKVLFNIPKENLICSFDYFPYKIEIKEAIADYLNTKQISSYDQVGAKIIGSILFAYDLMYLKYSNHNELNESLLKSKQSSQIVKPTNEVLDFVKSLPKDNLYNREMFDEDDKKLYDELIFSFKNELFLDSFDHVQNLIKSNSKFANNILPWISDKQTYKESLSQISSNTFELDLSSYEKIQNHTLIYMQNGYKQNEKLRDVYSVPGSCFVPAFELCNKQYLNSNDTTPANFEFIPSENNLKIAFDREFKKGDEIYFSEYATLSNDLFFLKHGLIKKDNEYSYAYVKSKIIKSTYTPKKHEVCAILGCFDTNLEKFVNDESNSEANVIFPVFKNGPNQNIIRALKLINLEDDKVKSKDTSFIHKLSTGKVFNTDVEFKVYARLRSDIKETIKSQKIKLVILHIKI